jgi:hypothetical protein
MRGGTIHLLKCFSDSSFRFFNVRLYTKSGNRVDLVEVIYVYIGCIGLLRSPTVRGGGGLLLTTRVFMILYITCITKRKIYDQSSLNIFMIIIYLFKA